MRSIDGYDLARELARGGMGVVYEARDRETGRPVALKLLLAVSDPDARARFQVEGQAAARLRHPGIVAVHSMGEAGGAPYLVMDLVRGETLERRLKRAGPFPPGDVVRIATAAAEALEHAHAQGIVHRDLKPSNMMLDEAGRVLLTDFGVAKLIDEAALRDLDRLQAVAPGRAQVERELRMDVLVRLGRAEALPLVDEELTRTDLQPGELLSLAVARSRVLVGLGREDEARAGLRAVLSRMPADDDRLLIHWSSLCFQGPPAALKEIVEVLGPVIERRPTASGLLRHRAVAYARLERMPEALDDARRAIALVPGDGHLHLIYGQWLMKVQEVLAGAAALERAVAVAPDDVLLRHQVANVYEAYRLLNEALRHRRAALARDPGNVMLMEGLVRTEQQIAERARAPRR